MIYLIPDKDSFITVYDENELLEEDLPNVIEIEELPIGEGILRRNEHGMFYYEPFPEPELEPAPKIPLDEKVDNLQLQVESDNLVTFEVLATMYEESGNNTMTSFEVMAEMYEEILLLREQVDQLTGGVQ